MGPCHDCGRHILHAENSTLFKQLQLLFYGGQRSFLAGCFLLFLIVNFQLIQKRLKADPIGHARQEFSKRATRQTHWHASVVI
jgi:hypothetical protein